MTDRERMLAVLKGQEVDRIPWIPRTLLWYRAHKLAGTLPPQWRELDLRQIERELGIGTPARDGAVFTTRVEGLEVRETEIEQGTVTEFMTPSGTVREVTQRSDYLEKRGLPGRVMEHRLKTPEDLEVWEYVVRNTLYDPGYEEFEEYDRDIGEEGLPLVSCGDLPYYDFAEKLAGYEGAFYQMADHPQAVDRLLNLMLEVHRERLWPVLEKSPGIMFLHGAHLSDVVTPPPIYERYVAPYYREFIPRMHKAGKYVVMHADADLSLILDHVKSTGWDMLECFVTAPMVPLTMERARQVFGTETSLWGGIPSTLLSPNVSEEEFRSYVADLFRTIAPGRAFVLGVADNVMPDSLIDRVRWISDYVRENGNCPIAS
jgi:hypothetical protein